jgi:hypothetical protein
MIPQGTQTPLAEVDFALSAVNDAWVEDNNRKTRRTAPICGFSTRGG